MAIPCPRCDRTYDVTLFEFGRTIHCTCGERVGLEQRIGPTPYPTPEPSLSSATDEPRFIADAMLGKVARWLRTLGYDTVYDDVADRVPPRVLERNESFSRCPHCGRIYWEGSHTERMRRLIDRVFEQ